jgi:hypothetical protein
MQHVDRVVELRHIQNSVIDLLTSLGIAVTIEDCRYSGEDRFVLAK